MNKNTVIGVGVGVVAAYLILFKYLPKKQAAAKAAALPPIPPLSSVAATVTAESASPAPVIATPTGSANAIGGKTTKGRLSTTAAVQTANGLSPRFTLLVNYDCSKKFPVTGMSISGSNVKSAAPMGWSPTPTGVLAKYYVTFNNGKNVSVLVSVSGRCDKKNFIDKLVVSEEKTAFRPGRH